MYNALKGGYTVPNIGYANLCLYRFISLFMFPGVKMNHQEGDTIAKAIQFLKSNIQQVYSVEEIANKFHYSASRFSTLF